MKIPPDLKIQRASLSQILREALTPNEMLFVFTAFKRVAIRNQNFEPAAYLLSLQKTLEREIEELPQNAELYVNEHSEIVYRCKICTGANFSKAGIKAHLTKTGQGNKSCHQRLARLETEH